LKYRFIYFLPIWKLSHVVCLIKLSERGIHMINLFLQLVPLLYDITFGKGSIALFDREKYLIINNGTKISVPLKTGDRIAPGSSSDQVLQTGKPMVKEIKADVMGIAYFAIAYPICVNDELIGGIVAAVPTEMVHISKDLKTTSDLLLTSLEEISSAIQSIAASSQVLANAGQAVSQSSLNVHQKAEETEKVVHYIDSVATNTKLLGLNASIEAARAGESGRGFSVVANEIQKMAVSSTGSAREIRSIVQGIRGLIGNMVDELGKFSSHTQEVSATIEEIGASLSSLVDVSRRLNDLANKL